MALYYTNKKDMVQKDRMVMKVTRLTTILTTFLMVFPAMSITPGCTRDERTCSYNGVCVDGSCLCDIGWKGHYCESLDLLPAQKHDGLFDLLHGPSQTSSWGGSIVKDDDGTYHMWYSEMDRHCGIDRWLSNSVVSHATLSSGSPNDPNSWRFEKQEVVFPIFSHEPIVVRDPSTGEYVMFLTHYPEGAASEEPPCNCTNGTSASGTEARCKFKPKKSENKSLYSYFSVATNPNGPWFDLVSLENVQNNKLTDMNLAPILLENGTALAWTRSAIWRADNWRDPESWVNEGRAWGDDGESEGEDPSLWMDRKCRFHILSHNGKKGQGGTSLDPTGDCGRHLFSETGAAGTWHVAPLPLGGCAYPRVNVTFQDGSIQSFYRRERPHLVFGADGVTPVALSTSVVDSPTPPRDACYTMLQPINHSAGAAAETTVH